MISTFYDIEWSKSVFFITFTSLAITLLPISFLIFPIEPLGLSISLALLTLLPLFGGIIYAFFNSPLLLELSDTQIIVHTRKKNKCIEYTDISSIEIYYPVKWEIMTFGIGGLFGFFGHFKNSKIGEYEAFVGDFNQAILIQMKDNKKYVISCKTRKLVMRRINQKIYNELEYV